MPGWVPPPTVTEDTVGSAYGPVLAGNTPGGVSPRAVAWVVAHDPPGCREGSHPGASSDKPSCGAPTTPGDLIWVHRGRHGMENLFYEALCPSREPE